MKAVIIRHGTTQGNKEKRYSGCRTDELLTDEGKAALTEITEVSDESLLFVSPMKRAKETAEILFPGKKQEIMEDLREMDFGIFEGKTHAELNGDPDYQAWIDSGGVMDIPEAETKASFIERTVTAFREAVSAASKAGAKEVFIVAHGGTIMAVMSVLTSGNYYDYLVPNGTGYSIDLEVDDAGNVIAAGSYNSFCGGISAGSSDR